MSVDRDNADLALGCIGAIVNICASRFGRCVFTFVKSVLGRNISANGRNSDAVASFIQTRLAQAN